MHVDPEEAGGMRGSRIFSQRGPTLMWFFSERKADHHHLNGVSLAS